MSLCGRGKGPGLREGGCGNYLQMAQEPVLSTGSEAEIGGQPDGAHTSQEPSRQAS